MKRIALLTTGGTIAGIAAHSNDTTGYTAGALGVDALLAAVPELATLADIVPEALFAIDSKDATPAHWQLLARRVASLLADPAIDGVVITHGTDTMEESAYFLHLTLPVGKPVVITGAMRPASALSADGLMNLYQAVAVASSGLTGDCGVVVVMNGEIHAARAVTKTHTLAVSALASPECGPLGRADPPALYARPLARDAHAFPLPSLKTDAPLPEVALITVPSGIGLNFLEAQLDLAAEHCAGLVLALPGHGSLPSLILSKLDQLAAAGWPMVRASRCGAGTVTGDEAAKLWPAGDLAPAKARMALMLAIASGKPAAFRAIAANTAA